MGMTGWDLLNTRHLQWNGNESRICEVTAQWCRTSSYQPMVYFV